MWLDVNGKRMQTGNTRTMVFSVAKIISHVSHYMTLLPGDVIAPARRRASASASSRPRCSSSRAT